MGPYTSKVQARKSLLHGGKKRKPVKTNKVKTSPPKGNPDSDAAKRERAAAKKKPPVKNTVAKKITPPPPPPSDIQKVSKFTRGLARFGQNIKRARGPGLLIALVGGAAALASSFKGKPKATDVAHKGISPPFAKHSIQSASASVKKNATAKPTTSKREDNFIETMRSAIEGSREGYSGRSIKYKGKIPDTRAKKSLAPPVRGASGDGPGPKDFKAPESTAKKDSRLAFEKYNKTGSKLGMKMDDILRGAFSFMGTLPKSTDEDKWKYKK